MHEFDTAVQKAHLWINEMATELDTTDKHVAYRAFRAALHALRDRLGVDETAQLGAQLPMVVRGVFYEGWHPAGKPLRIRLKEDFLDLVGEEAPGTLLPFDAELIARAFFRVLSRHLSRGEADALKHVLPTAIAELWQPAPPPPTA